MALYISYSELCHYVVEPLLGTLLPECIFNWRDSRLRNNYGGGGQKGGHTRRRAGRMAKLGALERNNMRRGGWQLK